MKKLYLIIAVFIFSVLNGQAPVIEWQRSLGGSRSDVPHSIIQTSDGGYMVVGGTLSDDGDVSVNYGMNDYWVVKMDAVGNIQWEKTFGGSLSEQALAVEQTSDGGYIIAGNTESDDGDIIGNHGDVDGWVLKLDTSGNIEWAKTYGGSLTDSINSIQQTADGGYIFAGSSNSLDGDVSTNQGSGDFWIVKLNESGNIQWGKTMGGSATDSAKSIQQTTDGGYIVAGVTWSDDGDVDFNHGSNDVWVVKLDSSGNILWKKSLGGSLTDEAESVVQTADGGYIIAGRSLSDDGDVSGNHGLSDFWIVKLNSSGNMEWQKSLGGSETEEARAVQQTSDGGYIIAGRGESSDGDSSNNYQSLDFWIVKLNNSGNILWEKNYGGTLTDLATSIKQTTDNGYIVCGYSSSNDIDVSGNHGNRDFWIVKLSPDAGMDLSETENLTSVLYPNPYTDKLVYKTTDELIQKIQFYDLSGKLLIQKEGNKQAEMTVMENSLPSGSYIMLVQTNKSVKNFKVIKK